MAAVSVDEVPVSNRTTEVLPSKETSEKSNARPALTRSSHVIQEEDEEEEEIMDEKKPTATSNVESKRASKRKSQLRHSYITPMVTETEFVPTVPAVPSVVDDRLLNSISAIEEALAARGIGAVNFTVHDDGNVAEGAAGEEEDNEGSVEMGGDEEKHPDARSMV
jgi:hypothetical protein